MRLARPSEAKHTPKTPPTHQRRTVRVDISTQIVEIYSANIGETTARLDYLFSIKRHTHGFCKHVGNTAPKWRSKHPARRPGHLNKDKIFNSIRLRNGSAHFSNLTCGRRRHPTPPSISGPTVSRPGERVQPHPLPP